MSDIRQRFVVWEKEDGYGSEAAGVTLLDDRLRAGGVQVGFRPLPFRLDYSLETGTDWVTQLLAVTARGDGWSRSLELRRSAQGAWSIESSADGEVDLPPPDGDVITFREALDCDLGLCPTTNTMPVLRHGLLENDGSIDFVMAWVSVPDLGVRRSRQRYTTLPGGPDGQRRIEYLSLDSDFDSVLTLDEDGLVLDYPKLARRVG